MARIQIGDRFVEVPDSLNPADAPDDLRRAATASTQPAQPPGWQPQNPGGANPQARAAYADMQRHGNIPGAASAQRAAGEAATAATKAAAPAGLQTAAQAGGLIGRATGLARNAARGTSRVVGGAAGAAIDSLAEGFNVNRVARDPNATGIDVATQAAEGIARVGGGSAGALAGAAIGAPFGGPLGALVGGGIGYLSGSTLADLAIKENRSALDLDTASPVDRTPHGSVYDAAKQRAFGGAVPTESTPATPAVGSSSPPPSIDRVAPAAPATAAATAPAGVPAGGITRDGNSYSGMNVGPNAQMYDPNGGLRQAAGGVVFGDGAASPSDATASALRTAQIYRDMSGADQPAQPRAPVVRHSGNDWQIRNNLRNAAIDANSISHQSPWAPQGSAKAAQDRYNTMAGEDAKAAGLQAQLEQKGNDTFVNAQSAWANANTSAAAQRYAADQGLRGMALRATADERQAAAINRAAQAKAVSDERKFNSESAIKQNELDQKNYDATVERYTQYIRDPKTGQSVKDPIGTSQIIATLDKIIPGFSTMGARARATHNADAEALIGLYNRTRAGDELGLGAIFAGEKPPRDSLPNFQDGQLRREGLWGLRPGGGGDGGYYWRRPDGVELKLGKDMSENEIKMLKKLSERKD